ncbi:hypothetical protein [Vreelandella olivaria]|uniref:hypothetical protein n=1 Tax=Vreelandella olivaria TaxID=390919 RepID=UPI00201F7824|nr:hypothetical protein [Halomonas olivaria]
MFGKVPAWLRLPLNLPATGEALKRRIGVEASQAVHSLRTATQGFRQFEIPSVSEAINRISAVTALTSAASVVGVGLDLQDTRGKVEQACTTGRERECREAQVIEYAALTGRTLTTAIGGPAVGAALSGPATRLCIGLRITPKGAVACSFVAFGGSVVAAERVGDQVGRKFGSELFNSINNSESTSGDD